MYYFLINLYLIIFFFVQNAYNIKTITLNHTNSFTQKKKLNHTNSSQNINKLVIIIIKKKEHNVFLNIRKNKIKS